MEIKMFIGFWFLFAITFLAGFVLAWNYRKVKNLIKRKEESIEDMIERIKDKEVKLIVKPKKTLKSGVIPFKTPEEREDEESGDTALEKRWIESGVAKEIMSKD